MAFSLGMSFHEGEAKMHKLLQVPYMENPTSTMLTAQAAFRLQHAPLLAIGTLDSQGRPWTTLWGGNQGFSEMLGGGIIGTRTLIDSAHDPVVQALVGHAEKGQMVQGNEKMVAGLTIDLMERKRVKLFGRVIAGGINEVKIEMEGNRSMSADIPEVQDQIQLITKIEQSMGNCPKYLNQYEIRPAIVTQTLASQSETLSEEARAIILQSDMFFLTTSVTEDMDTNHRGGPAGFTRVLSDAELVYPEYSGNRLYQSLGNLLVNPKIGITFPNYETGDVLYITGSTEVLAGPDAAALLPGSNLAVKIKVIEARLVRQGLPFRGTRKIPSPYNPLVRTLPSEGNMKASITPARKNAQLVKKIPFGPSICRFTFSVPEGIQYSPGQWVALDFSEHLDMGYSHMRDDDPRSLNDDFVRTFTISSTPSGNEEDREFEITIRNVGVVTDYLFRQNDRAGFEVSIVGIGGEFVIEPDRNSTKLTPFIAGGVGITPLLGQIERLHPDSDRLRLLWTTRLTDIDLAINTLEAHPNLARNIKMFFTGSSTSSDVDAKIGQLKSKGANVFMRRIEKVDLDIEGAGSFYLCAGGPLRKELLNWLEMRTVIFENFDY
ncbi:oxidoreductase-like protein [Bimuria novae-zelandiae CBS 107.79]|uniref:Oxidoreductase-like protein n=1 Tax=Bimuria novae-zelandiae CBS 107.79 TaxID=1447943 RepID=A0A6A5VH56_9PLEO|nr:oxidoreductase-like protein [Bimuria novae-zelandiae CBS 107.79]